MLSSKIILTAAHCSALIRMDDAYIILGDRSKVENENREQIIDLADSQWINHPDYDPKDEYRLDYAIIKLVKPVKFTDYVIPVCLPNSSYSALGILSLSLKFHLLHFPFSPSLT